MVYVDISKINKANKKESGLEKIAAFTFVGTVIGLIVGTSYYLSKLPKDRYSDKKRNLGKY